MEALSNGASHKNTSIPAPKGLIAKTDIATKPAHHTNGKAEGQKTEAVQLKPDTVQIPKDIVEAENPKPALSLDEKLKVVSDLHRKSVQRVNLITRIKQLETFEVTLANESDELNDNPYQGCKLIIRDDKNREFITATPGLIRKVTEYIYSQCQSKLTEIEKLINFPEI